MCPYICVLYITCESVWTAIVLQHIFNCYSTCMFLLIQTHRNSHTNANIYNKYAKNQTLMLPVIDIINCQCATPFEQTVQRIGATTSAGATVAETKARAGLVR